MKGSKKDVTLLRKSPIIYALRVGVFKDKTDSPRKDYQSEKVGENQYWNYLLIDEAYDFYSHYPTPPHPQEAPARAYHKIKEAHELFGLNIIPKQNVIEIGSAPGGITYYLLNLGVTVTSIDPAKMDQKLFDSFPQSFKHVRKSVFDVVKEELPREIDWVISDLNLEGDLNINQSMRIFKFYPKIKGAFLTIKTPKAQDMNKIDSWLKKIPINFKVKICNLPSHKKELGLIITKA